MRILITGMGGFVGRILCETMLGAGHEVWGLDLAGDGSRVSAVDITDLDAVTKFFARADPECVIHLSAVSRVDSTNTSILYNTNVTGTLNVLHGAVRMKNIPKVLLVSSSQVYGIVDPSRQPIGEDLPIKPVNHYGASKAASENIAWAFSREYGLPLVIVRPFNHIGRGQSPNFVVPKIMQAFKDKKSQLELGNIRVKRDFLDVRDVVAAYKSIIEKFPDGEIFNIASGKTITIEEIISKLREITGFDLNVKTGDELMRKNDIVYSIGDFSKIQRMLGWKPTHEITDTLKWILEG